MQPFIKWAGGKTQLLKEIQKRLPKEFNEETNTYVEPFVGGGALYFHLHPKTAIINDFNKELMNCYVQIRDNVGLLMELLDQHQAAHYTNAYYEHKDSAEKEYFYKMRDYYNTRILSNNYNVIDAALTIYLNKAGFNGLYRVNAKGLYNVPCGKRKKLNLYDRDNLLECSNALKNTVITSVDFEECCANLEKGDFVFFDSPYYDTFDTYMAGGFSEEDHKRLAKLYSELTEKGVYCLLTNSNTDFIKDLYGKYTIDIVNVKRNINSDGKNRKGEEVIITNYDYK